MGQVIEREREREREKESERKERVSDQLKANGDKFHFCTLQAKIETE